jgi:Fe-Mn family superoxide dismutase
MHSKFWENMAPAGKGGGGMPKGALGDLISAEFGSFERFRKEFSQAATSVEGSGWAALSFDPHDQRLVIAQIEKHTVNTYPFKMILVLDVWEHAYYLDYRNDRAKFIENFWSIVNWEPVEKRRQKALQMVK